MNSIISVIIPVYNVEKYLDKCLQSITNQTHKELEIILVDDGSQDSCPEICDRWQKRDSRIQVIHKTNGGLSDARNEGLRIASGDYIGFVDSDDWISEDMYERLLAAMGRDSSDISACAVIKVYPDGQERWLTHIDDCVLNRNEAQSELLQEGKLLNPVWYKLYRKDVIRGICFEVGKIHEDVYWTYQIVGNANRVSIISDTGYYYRQRSNSIMGKGYTFQSIDVIDAYEKRQEYFCRFFPELKSDGTVSIWNNCIFHGQNTLLYLKNREKQVALNRLDCCLKSHPICRADYSNCGIKRRIWLDIARVSFLLACRIRNSLRIGF